MYSFFFSLFILFPWLFPVETREFARLIWHGLTNLTMILIILITGVVIFNVINQLII